MQVHSEHSGGYRIDLVELAGGYIDRESRRHLVMGGPMMGFSLSGDQVPVVKATFVTALKIFDGRKLFGVIFTARLSAFPIFLKNPSSFTT